MDHGHLKAALALAVVLGGSAALAQTASAPAASAAPAARASAPPRAASAAASAPSSPAKKALVARLMKLEQPGIENMARQLVEQPALQLLQQANVAMQRVPAEQREQVAKDIQGDARKYVEDATPIVRDRAIALAPQTIGALVEERFTEDELKQLIGILESPVNRRFQAMGGEMQRALGQRLIADTKDSIEPKVRELQASVTRRLEAPASAPAPASPPPARSASAPK